MNFRVPKETKNFGDHRTHRRKKGCQSHLITISRVDRLASLREDQVVLSDPVEFVHGFTDLNVLAPWIEILPLEEVLKL